MLRCHDADKKPMPGNALLLAMLQLRSGALPQPQSKTALKTGSIPLRDVLSDLPRTLHSD
jgi:hypothetical protein